MVLGTTPLEKAQVISWVHRLLMGMMAPVAGMLRNKSDAFRDRALPGALDIPQIPELVDRGALQLGHTLPRIDAHLADSTWLAGDNLTFADIELLVGVNFMGWVKQSIPEDCSNLKAWYERAAAELT